MKTLELIYFEEKNKKQDIFIGILFHAHLLFIFFHLNL